MNKIELNKQEVEALIESLELDLDYSVKLDGYHRTIYRNILNKLKQYEDN